jgi:HEAT repeat protein
MASNISIEQALDAARAAATPEEQVKALLALGNFQDPRTLEVLGPALHSDKAEVRKAALEAMRWGTVEDKTTLTDVRSVVTSDPDPAVRQAGLDVIVLYDDKSPETHALLKDLAAEEDGASRDFALRELKRIEMEAKARSLPDPQVHEVQPQ